MTLNDGCSGQQGVALGLAAIWLSGCATGGSDVGGIGRCPHVVEYGRKFQARVAAELALLSEGSAIAEMLADYAVMRKQASACGERITQRNGPAHANPFCHSSPRVEWCHQNFAGGRDGAVQFFA
jgi:hypothetical protein